MEEVLVGIVIGAIILVPVVGIGAGILIWGDRSKIRSAPERVRDVEARRLKRETRSGLIWLAVVFPCVLMVAFGVIPKEIVRNGATALLAVFGAAFVIGIGWFTLSRLKNAKLVRALKLSNSGDHQGAIKLLREAIDEKPHSAILWNALSLVLAVVGRFDDALLANERAEQFGLDESAVATNKAYFLWKDSQFKEALEVNTTECERNSKNLNAAVHQCHILYDLEQHEEAEFQLRAVENLMEAQPATTKPERDQRLKILQDLREMIRPLGAEDR